MNRTFSEWGAMGCALGAVALAAFWATSLFWDGADFHLSFGGADLTGSDGELLLCDNVGNLEVYQYVDNKTWGAPLVVGDLNLDSSAIGLRRLKFKDGGRMWKIHVSALIPAVILALAGVLCWRRFRHLTRDVPASQSD